VLIKYFIQQKITERSVNGGKKNRPTAHIFQVGGSTEPTINVTAIAAPHPLDEELSDPGDDETHDDDISNADEAPDGSEREPDLSPAEIQQQFEQTLSQATSKPVSDTSRVQLTPAERDKLVKNIMKNFVKVLHEGKKTNWSDTEMMGETTGLTARDGL
jgi:hypothetical protein